MIKLAGADSKPSDVAMRICILHESCARCTLLHVSAAACHTVEQGCELAHIRRCPTEVGGSAPLMCGSLAPLSSSLTTPASHQIHSQHDGPTSEALHTPVLLSPACPKALHPLPPHRRWRPPPALRGIWRLAIDAHTSVMRCRKQRGPPSSCGVQLRGPFLPHGPAGYKRRLCGPITIQSSQQQLLNNSQQLLLQPPLPPPTPPTGGRRRCYARLGA